MSQSAELKDLATALASAQSSLHPAVKDSTNPHFKNRYASLQAVWDAARPALTANGLSVVQTFSETAGDTMSIVTTLLHKSGQYISGTLTMKPQRPDPQGIGSAVTYGRRYALAAILGIVADEDDDAEMASTPANAVPKARTAAAPARTVEVPREAPSRAGWRDVKIGFGKKKGIPLGELDKDSIAWWNSNYQPKPKEDGSFWPSDLAFRKALDEAAEEMLGVTAGNIDDEDVPF